MNYTQFSDEQLLSKLIGVRQSRRLYKGTLRPLFAGSSEDGLTHEKCAVARELILRSLHEEIRAGNALTSPGAVRDYLRLLLAGREYEVFVALFLDGQHRVL